MPRKFVKFLDGNNIYCCEKCGSHLASLSCLISRAFVGKTGKAFLFSDVINVKVGKGERAQLRTGIHVIADLTCGVCDDDEPIGWKYLSTEQADQKYKENKFILQRAYLVRENWIH